eukprot:CAMPEP_0168335696 /NCGR_PEP_ID=MMETSP0213-20121227/11074_1 /TAXON_ID=151035 /ORGANISM="Euplotes harpa, Strain FSP1.4" /LENGTH=297 /DNA_ID=CAMNT_0008340695 /DNA_START=13 /DNA_END=906 /DNA_ORIENTATION=-
MGDSKIKALHYFIRESNVGELKFVLEDIGSILGNKDFLQDAEIVEALRGYYESHLSHHELPNGTQVVVTAHGRREPENHKAAEGEGEEEQSPSANPAEFVYVDAAKNVKFSLDVTTGECKVLDDACKEADSDSQAFKEKLVESLDKYISERFKPGTTFGTLSVTGENPWTVHIDISCHNLNHKNFWGGEWLSRWTVTHTAGSSDFELTGNIKISNHYFEQGNIQFKLDKAYDTPVKGTAADGDVAQSVFAQISKLEEAYQNSLEAMYEDISENHMKNLRRRLPFTGKSFEWGVSKLV